MSKLTAEQRSALQSARAKNRKLVAALGNAGLLGVSVPKGIVAKIQAVEAFFAGLLDTSETTVKTNKGSGKATPQTDEVETDEVESSEAETGEDTDGEDTDGEDTDGGDDS